MPKTLRQLIKHNLQKHPAKTVYLIFLMTMTSLMFLLLPIYVQSEAANERMQKQEAFGSYQFALSDGSDADLQACTSNPYITMTNTMTIYGTLQSSPVGTIDQTDLLPLQFVSGRLPENDKEIALDQQALIEWNPDAKVGETYSFTFTLRDGSTVQEALKLVGIMQDYRLRMPVRSIGAFLTPRDWPGQYQLFYSSSTDKPYLDNPTLYINETVYPKLGQHPVVVMNTRQTVIFLGMIIGVIIMTSGIANLTSQESTQMQYLRGIGATQRQTAQMILAEISLIGLPAILLGSLLGYLLIGVLESILGYPFSWDISNMAMGIGLSILAMLGGLSCSSAQAHPFTALRTPWRN